MKTGEPQILNKFLENQEKSGEELLFGLFKENRQDEKVRLLLWVERIEDFSDFFVEVRALHIPPTLNSAISEGVFEC